MIRLILINTQEWLRLKFFRVVLLLSLAYVFLSYLLGSLSFTEQQRLFFDFGLAGIEIAVFFITAFISTHALHRDIDRKTILVVISRPIPRWNILVGYLGSLVILNGILILTLGLTLVLFLSGEIFFNQLLISLVTILLKTITLACFGLLVSTLARPLFAFVLTISYWLMSYSIPDLQFFVEKLKNPVLISIGKGLDFIIPRFYLFNWKSYYYLKSSFATSDILWAWSHCLGWAAVLFALASIAFKKKEIV